MFGQVHDNLVLYRERPTPSYRFRQIVLVELQDGQFVVHVFEGDVISQTRNLTRPLKMPRLISILICRPPARTRRRNLTRVWSPVGLHTPVRSAIGWKAASRDVNPRRAPSTSQNAHEDHALANINPHTLKSAPPGP
jgi:hypothetical protein